MGKVFRSGVAAFVVLFLAAGIARHGVSQPALKKVKFGVGTLVMNLTYPWASMPVALGYWRQAGYDVDVFASQSS